MQYRNLGRIFLLALICQIVSLIECSGREKNLEVQYLFKPELCDRKAKPIDIITVHYKGFLSKTGELFDSSYERNEPFSFQLGIGQVIRGWDLGLLDICVGEKRGLIMPPNMAYGDTAHEKIPANSELKFEVECLKIEDGPSPVNVFEEIDEDKDDKLSRHEVSEFLKKQLTQSYHPVIPGAEEPDEHKRMLEEVFEHEDKNKDGYIDREEFSGPKHNHDEL